MYIHYNYVLNVDHFKHIVGFPDSPDDLNHDIMALTLTNGPWDAGVALTNVRKLQLELKKDKRKTEGRQKNKKMLSSWIADKLCAALSVTTRSRQHFPCLLG